jgi:hypothetical protein
MSALSVTSEPAKTRSRNSSWKDSSTGTTRKISYSSVLKQTASKMNSKTIIVFMSGSSLVGEERGTIHAIMQQREHVSGISPHQRKAIAALIKD